MSAAGDATGAGPTLQQQLSLVLHSTRQATKCSLATLAVFQGMQQQDRLSALEDVVKRTLQIAAVPQLRDGNSKSAAVVSLQMLSFSLVNEAGLQAAGFNESGELHLYLDKAQQAAAGERANAAGCARPVPCQVQQCSV